MARVSKQAQDANRAAFDVAFEEVETDSGTALAPVNVITTPAGASLPVSLSGSNGELELQGPIAAIPAADSVPQNSIYFALDTGELLWTDGETWQPVGGGS